MQESAADVKMSMLGESEPEPNAGVSSADEPATTAAVDHLPVKGLPALTAHNGSG